MPPIYRGTAINASSGIFSKTTMSEGGEGRANNNPGKGRSRFWATSWEEGEEDKFTTLYHIRHGEWI